LHPITVRPCAARDPWARTAQGCLYDVSLEDMLAALKDKVSPFRLQGVVDHMYGEHQ
jgi:hypothetical protein